VPVLERYAARAIDGFDVEDAEWIVSGTIDVRDLFAIGRKT
jgi:hypothetical protein